MLRLPLEVRDLFVEWLQRQLSRTATNHVMKLVRDMRGGKDYDPLLVQCGRQAPGPAPEGSPGASRTHCAQARYQQAQGRRSALRISGRRVAATRNTAQPVRPRVAGKGGIYAKPDVDCGDARRPRCAGERALLRGGGFHQEIPARPATTSRSLKRAALRWVVWDWKQLADDAMEEDEPRPITLRGATFAWNCASPEEVDAALGQGAGRGRESFCARPAGPDYGGYRGYFLRS